ncbi:MAG: hypothetical protein H0W78_14530 [Planctomycetes bacterium]|nr:hypothetical protein [Planctomycetota bacterium]
MRTLITLLLVGGLSAAEAVPAGVPTPATITATDGSGPSASARAIEHMLAVDYAWAAARKNAELQAQARRAAAAKATSIAADIRGPDRETLPLTAGGLASLAGGDEVALLLELQRRRHRADGSPASNVVAAELAAALAGITATLPSLDRTPGDSGTVAHPGDDPHPGPRAPAPVDAPDRPEQFPVR